MTAQINDTFHHQGVNYAVAGISEDELFDPAILELQPVSTCTACWRGYQVVYSVVDKHLVVRDLHINLIEEDSDDYKRQVGPPINGVMPIGPKQDDDFDLFNNHYAGINYHLEYSGGLLLADGFIEELYVHMGFHPAWKYRRVVELIFENGMLSAEYDRSDVMAEIRAAFVDSGDDAPRTMPSNEEIRRFVERAFDRKYTREI